MKGNKREGHWEGVLPVWKPEGMTSHDAVARIRKILGMKRVGHTGTLDPQVTGVLPICLGRATRIVEYLQELPKVYRAELTVGYATDTEDLSGQITERADRVVLTADRIRSVFAGFIGEIEQVPPMYSAVKSDGVRLYELARQGVEVERKARRVTIFRLDIEDIKLDPPHPAIRFTVECSKGTYIRTLCADLGRALGYPAVMSGLVRLASGSITETECLTLEEIAELADSNRLDARVIPPGEALSHLPAFVLSADAVGMAWNGRKIALSQLDPAAAADLPLARVYAPDGRFAGIYRIDREEGWAVPEKLFT